MQQHPYECVTAHGLEAIALGLLGQEPLYV